MNDANREWSIQEIARLAGTTSRTLRHYGDVGLLAPTRIGANGYRYYDERALVRLQRILLLRGLGLGLPQIAGVLDRETAEVPALESHLAWLRQEQGRLARQIASVEHTIRAMTGEEALMAQDMFDGFDHTRYRREVEERWGEKTYADGDRWWRGMSEADKLAWQERASALARDWVAAAEAGADPSGASAQEVARRHVAWLTGIPGTPAAQPGGDVKAYVEGLADLYVADPRFGAHYATRAGGAAGAEFVRDALRVYAEANL